jgi:hypothetical protein
VTGLSFEAWDHFPCVAEHRGTLAKGDESATLPDAAGD